MMDEFLTPNEVTKRWPAVSIGILANWRLYGQGPPFYKKGWAILYPEGGIEAFERQEPWVLIRTRARSLKKKSRN